MIIILRGQEEGIVKYNFNLLNEINYSNEQKKELLSKMDNSLIKITAGLYVKSSDIQIGIIDDKYNFDNILETLKSKEKYKEYELYNDEQLLNYYKTKINFKRIKKLMIDILLSRVIKEAFAILYEEKYKYPFRNEEEASEYVNKYIDFLVLKDKTAKGATNRYTLKTIIFLKNCKEFYPQNMSDVILYDCLYTGIIIKVFLHELNHGFYNFYYYHSNGTTPLSTPRKKKIEEREGGRNFELLLFTKIIRKIQLDQALYIINKKNYDKSLNEFSKDFQSSKENDLKLEDELSYLNEEITKLKYEREILKDYYLKTDDDNYFDLNDFTLDAEIKDDVIGSFL